MILQAYLLVRLLFVLAAFALPEGALAIFLFLKGSPAACMESPVFEPKLDISFCALEPHFGHFAGFFASLIGRINSNSFRHLGQRYSYVAICDTSLTWTWPAA
jgi:hypothetical protein